MERREEILNDYREEFGREPQVDELRRQMTEATSRGDTSLFNRIFDVWFVVYYSNLGIVEFDDGPMVTPATPGASAPTVLGGNISTVDIRDLIHSSPATNLPWNTGRETLPIQTPGPRDGISCMGIACSPAEVPVTNLIFLYAPPAAAIMWGSGGAAAISEAWEAWAWRGAAAAATP
jgi:hypothetical protein